MDSEHDHFEHPPSRPAVVDAQYLASLIIDHWLKPEADPAIAGAIVDILIERGSLQPSAVSGWEFRDMGTKTTDEPHMAAFALLRQFTWFAEEGDRPFLKARVGRLIVPDYTFDGCLPLRGQWQPIPEICTEGTASEIGSAFTNLKWLWVEARSEVRRITWHYIDLVAEFPVRSAGELFAAFILRDAETRLVVVDVANIEQSRLFEIALRELVDDVQASALAAASSQLSAAAPILQAADGDESAVESTWIARLPSTLARTLAESGLLPAANAPLPSQAGLDASDHRRSPDQTPAEVPSGRVDRPPRHAFPREGVEDPNLRGVNTMSTNLISEVTKRDIYDSIVANFNWSGRLGDYEFAARFYDLKALPSTDPRFKNADEDIWQHRVRNSDWEPDWIFSDPRFGIMSGSDSQMLEFLCHTLDPLVRAEKIEVEQWAALFCFMLKPDGFELFIADHVSGRPMYGSRRIGGAVTSPQSVVAALAAAVPRPSRVRQRDRRDAVPVIDRSHDVPPISGPPDRLITGWKDIRAALKRLGLAIEVSKEALRDWAKAGKIPIKIDPNGGRPSALESQLKLWCDTARRERELSAAQSIEQLTPVERAAETGGGSIVKPSEAVAEFSEGASGIGRRKQDDVAPNPDKLGHVSRRGQSRK